MTTASKITARENGNITPGTYGFKCNGCGQSFDTLRGAHTHQSAKFVTVACRPQRARA